MEYSKISDLPAATALDGTELIELEQGGNSRQAPISDISTRLNEWETGHIYYPGQMEMRNNSIFLCITYHISGTFYTDWLTNGYWVPISDHPGKIIIHPRANLLAGYLECDNSTIGPTGSGADYEGDQYRELYEYLSNIFGGTHDWAGGNVINLPDTRGVFLRGVGSSAKLNDAQGNPFAGVLGTYQNDKFQGHWHTLHSASGAIPPALAIDNINTNGANYDLAVKDPCTDGVNGIPRTGSETNPANLSVKFIIKY